MTASTSDGQSQPDPTPAATATEAYEHACSLVQQAIERGRVGDGPVYVRIERVQDVAHRLGRLGVAAGRAAR